MHVVRSWQPTDLLAANINIYSFIHVQYRVVCSNAWSIYVRGIILAYRLMYELWLFRVSFGDVPRIVCIAIHC